jgi:hypothetical protein
MARNEDDLKSRWQTAYRNSGEYQAALRRDAIAKVQRDRQGHDAMRAALAKGDAMKAAAIQSALLREDSQPGEYTAGLDAFQDKRANDYIAQAETRGQEKANEARRGPLSGVAFGPGYYESLENPDFATHFPYGDISPRVRIGMGDTGRSTASAQSAGASLPSSAAGVAPNYLSWSLDPSGVTRQKFLNAENDRVAEQRHEQHFTSSLPPELRPAYAKITSDMTPKEKTDFLAQPPELRYGRLRSVLAENSPRTPNMGGTITTPSGIEHDFLPSGAPRVGSVGSSDFPAIMKPVTLTRPAAVLVKPPAPPKPADDYLAEGAAFGF